MIMTNLPARLVTVALAATLFTAAPLLADALVLTEKHVVIGPYRGGGPGEFRVGTGELMEVHPREKVISLSIGYGRIAARAQMRIADTDLLVMKDGTEIEGRYAGGDETELRLKIDDEVKAFPLDKVVQLILGHPDPEADYSIQPE